MKPMMPESPYLTEGERSELSARLAQVHADFLRQVVRIRPSDWNRQPEADSWSPAEIFEHVLLVERMLQAKVTKLVAEAPSEDWKERLSGKRELLVKALPAMGKARAGVAASTFIGVKQVSARHFLSETQKAFDELLDKTSEVPLRAILVENSHFGSLSAELTLLYIPLHTERHLRQLALATERLVHS